ncbi:MAG: cytochrome c oxidase subunit [Solirubrobacteraceae bacterium]|nr:cytochrome c oxidase subunit [Solirubrobacteraceae bacterium]
MPAALHILAGILIPERGGSKNASDIAELYALILVMATIVFLGVEGTLLWFLIRFKARRGRVAAQIHGNTRLEIGWTVGAAVILVFITVVTFIKLPGIKNPAASDIDANGAKVASTTLFASTDQPAPPKGASLNIVVDGQQYVWRFQYPRVANKEVFSYEEMVVPVGMTVTLDITADDVAHSWWIPKLGGKMDALPGYTNHTWFKADKPGTFNGQCAELCGRNHANMLARVRAVPFDQYQAWYDRQAADIKSARDEAAKQRAQIQKQQQEAAQRSATP